ncbi:MAG: alpha-amylase [Cyanobacteria bacterium REEB459]|nr:alpha-amylase [Cyanobacteria bacterium REEB459]
MGFKTLPKTNLAMAIAAIALVLFTGTSTAQAKTYEIMLQGFHWNSPSVSKGWYTIIKQNTPRIKDSGFTLVWFPPPSKSASDQGYLPNELNNFNSRYGSESELKSAVSGLKPEIKSLADIVINHRVGTTNWHDFTNPTWSTTTITKDDEDPIPYKSVNNDTGAGYDSARDLDHLNPETIKGIKLWLNKLRRDIGFDGWRYDMVKGYLGQVIQQYNDYTNPSFSVGEFWDDNPQKVVGWIDSTHQNWQKRSTAFDFPLRNALYQAVTYRNYNWLKYTHRTAGVIGLWSDKAVTFVENHDTEEARNGQYAPAFPDDDRMLQGYAFILTHPGTPCVFWKDIFDNSSDRESQIKQMIAIRKRYGLHSQSQVFIDRADQGLVYAAYIKGDRGEIAMKIGPGAWQPSGSKWDPQADLLSSGADYAIWGDRGWSP